MSLEKSLPPPLHFAPYINTNEVLLLLRKINLNFRRNSEGECRFIVLVCNSKIAIANDVHSNYDIIFIAIELHSHDVCDDIASWKTNMNEIGVFDINTLVISGHTRLSNRFKP